MTPWWPTAEEWQAIFAYTTMLVAVAAAAVALRQYSLSVSSRIDQGRPYVHIDFAFDRTMILFEVRNTGLTAAEDIRFEWSERPVANDPNAQASIDRGLIENGIPFLAPGRTMRFFFGPYRDDLAQRQYRVAVSYFGNGDKRRWRNVSVMDIGQWSDVVFDHDSQEAQAKHLERIAKYLSGSEGASRSVGRAAELLRYYLDGNPETEAGREKERELYAERARLAEEDVRLTRLERGQDPDTGEPLAKAAAPADSS